MKLNKNINYKVLSLYLKYGYISLPGFKTIYKNKKINTWLKPPYKTSLKTDTDECLQYFKKRCETIVKKLKIKRKKICLLLSSGQDSRLIYKVLEEIIIKHSYQKNFFCFTGRISHFNDDYDESAIIKKFWNIKPINHKIITINKKNIFKKIFLANQINHQPVNGVPNIIFLSCVEKICKKFGNNKVHIVTGIGDQIFFNALGKQAKKQQKKGSSLINANEGSIFKNSTYLTSKYEKLSDKLFKKIKTKEHFFERHFLHKYINQMAFNYRGPKVITEFKNIFKYFQTDFFAPFTEKKFINLILSLKKKNLHDGKNKKTFIHDSNIIIDPNQKMIVGLKIISPQREFLYENRKKILQIINTSILTKKGIVDKKKILSQFKSYLNNFKRFKKNKKMFQLFNSYSIWKFLSSEIFLRSCK